MSERTAIKDKRILITGGTGSLGQALVARWYKDNQLTILSRNPHRQSEVAERFGLPADCFVLADICDYEAVKRACIGQDILIHAAALKVVSQGEANPEEYMRVNCLGTQTVVRAWEDTHFTYHPTKLTPEYPRSALYINSDKSASPINVYGCGKKVAEAIFLRYGFSSLRYGNVVESQGSFIHKWQAQIAKGQKITLREPEPTRFFVSMTQAVDLVEDALFLMKHNHNGIFVPYALRTFSVYDVARALYPISTHLSRLENIADFEPLQPGEKQHEILTSEGEYIKPVSEMLALVKQDEYRRGNPDTLSSNHRFLSRMTGKQVLEALGISPRQKEFS